MRRAMLAFVAAGILASAGYFVATHLEPNPTCDACHRAIHAETMYRLFLQDGGEAHACCPRCGIRHERERVDVVSADVADFNSKKRIDAEKAFYVEDSAVIMCRHDNRLQEDRTGGQYALTYDRCLPSLVAFETREAAEAFRRVEGGSIKTYAELKAETF